MNVIVEIWAEAALFPENEYIDGISVEVHDVPLLCNSSLLTGQRQPKRPIGQVVFVVLTGIVTRDFLLQVFFMNHLS